MTEPIEFAKLSGSGNDFICIDNRNGRHERLLADRTRIAAFARALCHRGRGIGADGLILACRPEIEEVAAIAARFFEADGSEAELCGNGTACFVRWVGANRWGGPGETKILTSAGIVRGLECDDGYVRVCIPLPEKLQTDLELTAGERTWTCDFAVTGVPHLVIYVPDVEEVDLARWGPAFRFHERFRPRGVNANFVQVLGEGRLAVRTWEFGVEGETLACGTGSAAAAILASRRFGWPAPYRSSRQPILIRARSGQTLKVYLTEQPDGAISDLCLETIVLFLYSGQVHPSLLTDAMEA